VGPGLSLWARSVRLASVKVSEGSIDSLVEIVTGSSQLSRYRRGIDLVRLFNAYGSNDVYGPELPNRAAYTETKIRGMSGTPALAQLLCEVLHPREFLDLDIDQQPAIDYLNRRLKFDGYEITTDGDGVPRVRSRHGSAVGFVDPLPGTSEEAQRFLDEQIHKCDDKLREGDWDGAVTNARSMLETVLCGIERVLDTDAPDYDGDLGKLYKRVQKLLALEPSRPDLEAPLKQVLSGLSSVVAGIAGVSNKMGDRHVRTYAPKRRHAVLVVDSAKTLASFLVNTYRERQ
jgi:hypothetical protein